jgi:hypothetical protein
MTMIGTKVTMAAVGAMLSFDAVGMLAQASEPGVAISFAGVEKLGVAAILVAVLLWLLKEERADRAAVQREMRELERSVRDSLIPIVDRHTEVLERSVQAHQELTKVIGKALDS